MISAQRRKIIIDKINSGMPLSVSELSRELGVSPMTIRRDLSSLEKEGLLTRTHGGAVPVGGGSEEEPSFDEKLNRFPAEKLAIARKAAELIKDGDTILLNAGTTVTALARLLKDRQNLTVVTNTVNIAMELAQSEGINLVLTGGNMRTRSYAMVGTLTERVLREIHVQKAFLGVNGISIEHGLTTPNMTEAHTNSLMIKAADEIIVLADHSKIGRVTLSRFAPIEAVSTLITDRAAPPDFIEELVRRGIEVIVV
ncbi:DeoR/GlpR family DNA-binding transcription regulator [Moorella sp. ACPs]|uniref:DeoR/GlpR family DNA-binding transcription regulator n=1 Tax=Neomoorella carbonis TaxID=3062783 RepID=UPI003244D21D